MWLFAYRSLFCRPDVPIGESQRLTEVAEGAHELVPGSLLTSYLLLNARTGR
jgi:hypothetical protein